MKKFDRLPPQQRKEEIKAAALKLFNEKGFAATTMENIVEGVSLSKGGVYRIYPSTAAILSDLMISGMQLRNAYYEERAKEEIAGGRSLSLPFLIDIIVESLLLYPEFSKVYVEFLWEKRRNPALQELYLEICSKSRQETLELIQRYGAEDILMVGSDSLAQLTELMNGAILSIHVLGLQDFFSGSRKKICAAIMDILSTK